MFIQPWENKKNLNNYKDNYLKFRSDLAVYLFKENNNNIDYNQINFHFKIK